VETREALEDIAFAVTRLGVVMTPQSGEPQEAWGVLNPASVRAKDDSMHLFPRLVAQGNYSRIGHARVRFEGDAPMGVERLGIALEPHESYEVNQSGGGVEDPRVVYVPMLNRYVMTYTAYVPVEPRVALAVSKDLHSWVRLGPLRYEDASGTLDLTRCGNKDAAFFPDVVLDPQGVPSLALLHRPTTRVRIHGCECEVTLPPCGEETREYIWISYVPVAAVLADIANLTSVRRHEQVMAPEQLWERNKVGAGAPPIRLSYHAVSDTEGHPRYCMGAAILDLERPSRVLYRTSAPILEPQTKDERNGRVSDVVFPTATDMRPDGLLDVYYGAADRVIAAARLHLPSRLPTTEGTAVSKTRQASSCSCEA
jgi:predicted GH43/DUF377 family glycosyl hydrolase